MFQFINALKGFKAVKQIPHTLKEDYYTKMAIKSMERDGNPMLEGSAPETTMSTTKKN